MAGSGQHVAAPVKGRGCAGRRRRQMAEQNTLDDPAPAQVAERAPEFVTALDRGLTVLTCFGAGRRSMTLSQVAAACGLSRGTARRFLLTLQTLGYVGGDGKWFWLTPKVLRLATAYLSSNGLAELARPVIRRVTEQTGESSSLAVLDGADIVYIARVETRRIFSSGLEPGARLPAHCSSLGRVLLAAMEPAQLDRWLGEHPLHALTPRTVTDPERLRAKLREVRQQGYAVIDGEIEIGIRSISVPVIDPQGRTVAALNIGTLAARVSLEQMRRELLPVLRGAAREIGAAAEGL